MLTKKLAIDTYYTDSDALTVGIYFNDWKQKNPSKIISYHSSDFAPYIPGEFYKRELPGILGLLEQVKLEEIDTIIIDGFVHLPKNRPGLGMHLWESLEYNPNLLIVGIAKNYFSSCEEISIPVCRGESKKPLWVDTNGAVPKEIVAKWVKEMHGKYRIPSLLKILDKETKKK